MKIARFFVLLLMVVGSLNWGLWGFIQYDLIRDFFGSNTTMARVIYGIVGFAGLWGISFFFVPEIYKCKCSCQK